MKRRSHMFTSKKWVGAVALIVFAALIYSLTSKTENQIVAAPAEKTVWKLFKPQSGRFEVLLPQIPQHAEETHPNGKDVTKYDVYLAQDHEGSVYMVSLTQYPEGYDMGSVEDVLEAVKNGAVGSNAKNEVKKVERSTFLNLPSLDFLIENPDSGIRSKVIVDNKTLIVLTAMNRDPSNLEKDFNNFAGSFVLKNQ